MTRTRGQVKSTERMLNLELATAVTMKQCKDAEPQDDEVRATGKSVEQSGHQEERISAS